MVDIEIVKENYRRMSDDELKRFTKLEAENLSLDAFHALKDELAIRNIDLEIIEELEDVDIPEKRADNAVTNLFLNSLFEFVFDEKSQGISNNEIYHGLLAKRLSPEQALMVIQMLEEVTQKTLKSIETDILVAWVSFFIGILICLFTFNQIDIKFIFGALITLAASVRLANAYPRKRKLILVLENCKNDRDANPKNLYQ